MIEIIRYNEIKKGSVSANFAIKLNKMMGFCIHNMTLFEKEPKRWITFPSVKIEKDGKTKYLSHCGFENFELNEEFKVEIIKSLDNYIADKKHPEKTIHIQEEVPF
jgi:hypothetical protein